MFRKNSALFPTYLDLNTKCALTSPFLLIHLLYYSSSRLTIHLNVASGNICTLLAYGISWRHLSIPRPTGSWNVTTRPLSGKWTRFLMDSLVSWRGPSPISLNTTTSTDTTRPWVTWRPLMSSMTGENRSYSVERRFKYKQLIVAETTTRASGSLLMPPDYAKVFGSKSVPFRWLTTGSPPYDRLFYICNVFLLGDRITEKLTKISARILNLATM